jgi:hypothetical protein
MSVTLFRKVMFVAALALAAAYVVRGLRRGDAPKKILDDSLPVGLPLFMPLGLSDAPWSIIGIAGMLSVIARMLWVLARSKRAR